MPFVGIGVGVGRQRFRGGFVGLLDEYSGAAAAYSLRQLSSTYTGDAIRVRRASDNTELNIGFVNNVLDTATLESFCSGTDGFVTTWYDQSGNAVDATQATAANQPKIVSSGSVILEGIKPAIEFPTSGIISLIINTNTNYKTLFTIAKISEIKTLNYIAYSSVDSNGVFYGGTFSGVNGLGIVIGLTVYSLTGEDLNRHLGYFNNTGTSLQIARDGSSATDFTTSTNLSFNTISRPVSNIVSFNGIVQEMIFYTDSMTTNRTGIETNINDFYSIY